MPYKNREDYRANQRRRYRQLTDLRLAANLCPKCGKLAPEPDRRLCAPCGEKRRAADRARYAKAKTEGRLATGKRAEAKRRSSRVRTRKRYQARLAAGTCVRCGRRPPTDGSPSCDECRVRRNRHERVRWNARRESGLCGSCGEPAPGGEARCEACATLQNNRPARKVYARKLYSRRRARKLCTDCGTPAGNASRCEPCARRSYVRSGEHRGMPAGAPTFFVIEIETGHTLSEWETLAEARASVAFAKIDPDTVAIEADIPMMSTVTSW